MRSFTVGLSGLLMSHRRVGPANLPIPPDVLVAISLPFGLTEILGIQPLPEKTMGAPGFQDFDAFGKHRPNDSWNRKATITTFEWYNW